MKRLLSTIFLTLMAVSTLCAQKYAAVNTDYILANLPEYKQAQERIDRYVEEWQREIESKMQELDQLQKAYQQESYMLPDNLKARRQQEIKTRDQELRDLQRKRFAADGDLDKKRAEMLKPLQDRVYNAIERIAKEKGYAFVFDKSGSPTVLYVSEKYDITNQVLEALGVRQSDLSNGSNDDKKGNKGSSNPAMRRK